MANNIIVKDGSGANVTLATVEANGVHTPAHAAVLYYGANAAGNTNPVFVTTTNPGGDASASNQVALKNTVGEVNDSAYNGSGNTSVMGALKGIYSKFTGIALGTSANTIGKVGVQVGGTDVGSGNPVPVNILGNSLDPSTGTNQTTLNSTVGTTSDAAWSGTGDSTLISALKAIWTKLSSVGVAAGSNTIGKVGVQVAGSDVANTNPVPVDVRSLQSNVTIATGTNVVGKVGVQVTGADVSNTNPVPVDVRSLQSNVTIATSTNVIGKVGVQISGVDTSNTNPVPVSIRNGISSTEYTEDAAAPADPTGSVFLAVRRDTLSSAEVSADGDVVAAKATSKGQIHVYAEVSNANTAAAIVEGAYAASTTANANPVVVGGRAVTSLPTAVSNGQATYAMFDKDGRQIVSSSPRETVGWGVVTCTANNSENTLITASAGVYRDVYRLMVSNMDSTNDVTIKFRDVAGGGTPFTWYIPAKSAPVGFSGPADAARKQGTANSAWTYQFVGTNSANVEIQFDYIERH